MRVLFFLGLLVLSYCFSLVYALGCVFCVCEHLIASLLTFHSQGTSSLALLGFFSFFLCVCVGGGGGYIMSKSTALYF